MENAFLSHGGDVDFKNSHAWHAGSNIASYVLSSENDQKPQPYSCCSASFGFGQGVDQLSWLEFKT